MQLKTAPLDLDAMHGAAEEASHLLKSLASRHRLLILCQLVESARSVGELATLLDIRDTVASQHLAVLRRGGFVNARREGQTIWYSIADTPAQHLLAALFGIYCRPEPVTHSPNGAQSRTKRIRK